MRERQLRIECRRFLSILFSDRSKILAQEHSRGEQIGGTRVRGNAKHFGKRLARVEIIFGLDIANSQDIRRIYVCTGEPSLDFLEWSDRFCRSPRQVI